jgi:hypothetical protein
MFSALLRKFVNVVLIASFAIANLGSMATLVKPILSPTLKFYGSINYITYE